MIHIVVTARKKSKIRLSNTRSRSQASPSQRYSQKPSCYEYHKIYTAELPPKLESLHSQTKPGVRGFPSVDEAQALLAHTLKKRKVTGPLLDLSAMGGLLGHLPSIELYAVESSAAALKVLQTSGFHYHSAIPGDSLNTVWPKRIPTVALVLAGDRGNAYAQAQITWAHACTPPGGTLYLAGDRQKGFDRYVRFAASLFGTGETIVRDKGMRVAALTRRPGPTPAYPDPEKYEAFGLKVIGLPGVFSASKVDQATTLLLQSLNSLNLADKDVLDLGCGTGVIGAWAASRGANVTMIDQDLSSVKSAEATLIANQLSGKVLHSDIDVALGKETFDLILSNPPFHVGRGVVLDVAKAFITSAAQRLRPNGQLYIVCNDFLPYEPELTKVGTVTTTLCQQGFKVLLASQAK